MTHKPFDREKALAGEPVITGDGFEVLELHYFPAIKKIVGYGNDNMILTWNDNGLWDNNGTPSKYDLFMKPKKITKWYNIHYNPNFKQVFFELYDTEEAALNDLGPYYLETHLIEIEE